MDKLFKLEDLKLSQGDIICKFAIKDLENQYNMEKKAYNDILIRYDEYKKKLKRLNSDVNLLEHEISEIEKELSEKKILFEAGAISQTNLNDAVEALNKKIIELQFKQEETDSTVLEEFGTSREEIFNYELNVQDIKVKQLKEKIDMYRIIAAKSSGYVVSYRLEEGKLIQPYDVYLEVVRAGSKYSFETVINNRSAELFEIGENIKIYDKDQKVYTGKLASKTKDTSDTKLIVALDESNLEHEKVAYLSTIRDLGRFDKMVPNSAMHKDSAGFYVYVLDSRKTILGEELFVRKVEVKILESNDTSSGILSDSLNKTDRIVINSHRPLHEGLRIVIDYSR